MPGALRELIALFEVGFDTEDLKKGEKAVDGFIDKLESAARHVTEAFALEKVHDFFKEQIESSAHLQDLAERLDISAEALSNMSLVAAGAGLDLDTMAHSLGFLQRNLGEARTKGGELAQAFRALKVPIKEANGQARPMLDVILDVAEGMHRLPDQQQRAAYAMRLFGREGRVLLPVLAQGREKIMELYGAAEKLGSGLGEDYYKQAKAAREASERFAFALDSIKERALSAALPAIMRIYDWLTKGAAKIIDFTKKTNVLTTGMLFLATVATVKLLPTLWQVLKMLGIVGDSATESVTSLLKFGGVTSVIFGLYMVFDDLYTLMTGGNSVIGELLTQMGGVEGKDKFVKDLRDAWQDVVGVWDENKHAFGEMLDAMVEAIPDLIRIALNVGQIGRWFFHSAKFGGKILADSASAANAQLDPARMSGGARGAGAEAVAQGAVRDFWRDWDEAVASGAKDMSDIANVWQKRPAGGSARPVEKFGNQAVPDWFFPLGRETAASGVSSVGGSTVHQRVEINNHVHGVPGDPHAVAEAAGQGTRTAVEKANNRALQSVNKR